MYHCINQGFFTFVSIFQALDPEGDPARFSLLSGDSQHFDIGASSGTIRVVSQLDRESQDTYTLVIVVNFMQLTGVGIL